MPDRPYNYLHYCSRVEVSPTDYSSGYGDNPSFDELYRMWMSTGTYYFIEPIYTANGTLSKLVFATIPCAVCESSSSGERPDYWIDLN